MKKYQIELVRTSYLDIIVEADDREEAIEKAYEQLDIPEYEKQFWDLSYVDIME